MTSLHLPRIVLWLVVASLCLPATACFDEASRQRNPRLTIQWQGCKGLPPPQARFVVTDNGGGLLVAGEVTPESGCNAHIEPRVDETHAYTVKVQGVGTKTWTYEYLEQNDFWIYWSGNPVNP